MGSSSVYFRRQSGVCRDRVTLLRFLCNLIEDYNNLLTRFPPGRRDINVLLMLNMLIYRLREIVEEMVYSLNLCAYFHEDAWFSRPLEYEILVYEKPDNLLAIEERSCSHPPEFHELDSS